MNPSFVGGIASNGERSRTARPHLSIWGVHNAVAPCPVKCENVSVCLWSLRGTPTLTFSSGSAGSRTPLDGLRRSDRVYSDLPGMLLFRDFERGLFRSQSKVELRPLPPMRK